METEAKEFKKRLRELEEKVKRNNVRIKKLESKIRRKIDPRVLTEK